MSTVVGRVIVQSKPFAAVNCRKMSTVVGDEWRKVMLKRMFIVGKCLLL